MTSILKVSTIQDPTNSNTAISIDAAGKVTAPNLVMPAGTMIKTYSYISSQPETSITVGDGTYVAWDSFTVTTQANSRLILWFETNQYTADTNIQVLYSIDGTLQAQQTEYSANYNHVWYANGSRPTITGWVITPALSAGSHTLQLHLGRHNNGTLVANYQSQPMRYMIHEIAG